MAKSNGLVHVIDDDAVSLWHLSELLTGNGLECVSYHNAKVFFDAYVPRDVECLVCDLRMPDINGLQVQETLRAAGHDIPIIFVSAESDVPSVVAAMRNGAHDFIEKPIDSLAFIEMVQAVLLRQNGVKFSSNQMLCERLGLLTKREKQILKMVVEGMSSLMIAERLDLSVRTVENHRARIKDKVGVSTTVELIGVVYEAKDFLNIKY